MSQGFTQNLPIPVPVNKGGTGVVTSTGSGANVLGTAPTIDIPNIVGTTTATNADAGSVGEVISSIILTGSAVAVSPSGTTVNVTSISLTAGDWDVWGDVNANSSASSTSITNLAAGITTVSATLPVGAINTSVDYLPSPVSQSWVVGTTGIPGNTLAPCRINISATTTIYLVARVLFTVSTASVFGRIIARRMR